MAPEQANSRAIRLLYHAISHNNTSKISGLLSAYLEWWFHGPRRCHHMMRILTGEATPTRFRFDPLRVTAIGPRLVVAEGGDGGGAHYWVHVWTIEKGLITQFREYFDTRLVVREVDVEVSKDNYMIWESKPWGDECRSLPELVLAI